MTEFCTLPSPIGSVVIRQEGDFITGISFDSDAPRRAPGTELLRVGARWVDGYFSGEISQGLPFPIRLSGTEFQRTVWELLQAIPYGQRVTYGALAAEIAQLRGIARMSAQAVGQAVGKNPIAIAVPCHRVVGAGRALGGYAYRAEKKLALLQLEAGVLAESNKKTIVFSINP